MYEGSSSLNISSKETEKMIEPKIDLKKWVDQAW